MTEPSNAKNERSNQIYQRAYAAVLNNQYWYSDRPQLLSETFNAENTRKRAEIVIDILRRAARRKTERHLSEQYLRQADKLSACRLDRCGSAACLECLRAFQQAKTAAHRRLIRNLSEFFPTVLWCLVTIIPREINYQVGRLNEFDAAEFNRHLKETLGSVGINRPFVGSIDFSLELSPIGKYWQPHWHFTLHTQDPELLREELKWLFPSIDKYDYSVDLTEVGDLGFVPYIHKVIRIKDLLRTSRTYLPELLLMLDRINPLDLMVFQGMKLTAQDSGFSFQLPSQLTAQDSGFSFQLPSQLTAQDSGFSFQLPSQLTAQDSGFSFQLPSQLTAQDSGFSFQLPSQLTAQDSGFSFQLPSQHN